MRQWVLASTMLCQMQNTLQTPWTETALKYKSQIKEEPIPTPEQKIITVLDTRGTRYHSFESIQSIGLVDVLSFRSEPENE